MRVCTSFCDAEKRNFLETARLRDLIVLYSKNGLIISEEKVNNMPVICPGFINSSWSHARSSLPTNKDSRQWQEGNYNLFLSGQGTS